MKHIVAAICSLSIGCVAPDPGQSPDGARIAVDLIFDAVDSGGSSWSLQQGLVGDPGTRTLLPGWSTHLPVGATRDHDHLVLQLGDTADQLHWLGLNVDVVCMDEVCFERTNS